MLAGWTDPKGFFPANESSLLMVSFLFRQIMQLGVKVIERLASLVENALHTTEAEDVLTLGTLMHKYWWLVTDHALVSFLHERGVAYESLTFFGLLKGELTRVDEINWHRGHSEVDQHLAVDSLVTDDQVELVH